MLPSLSAAALAFLVLDAHAQGLTGYDRGFIAEVAQAGHAEVAAGEAAAKSENQAVAAFGRQMVEEHTKMNEELAGIARQLGTTPPESPDVASQAKTALTGMLPGTAFDKQYVSSQISDHQQTLERLQGYAQVGEEPALKAFVEKYIPVVQRHIAELQELQKRPELQ